MSPAALRRRPARRTPMDRDMLHTILARLDAIERRLAALSPVPGAESASVADAPAPDAKTPQPGDGPPPVGAHGSDCCNFHEKWVIDRIVHLIGERIDRAARHLDAARGHPGGCGQPRQGPPCWGPPPGCCGPAGWGPPPGCCGPAGWGPPPGSWYGPGPGSGGHYGCGPGADLRAGGWGAAPGHGPESTRCRHRP
jgi:hypothetical protein